MENINAIIGLGATALILIAAATWMSPEALEWCIMRLRMRHAYIIAGRDAAETERKRFEVAA